MISIRPIKSSAEPIRVLFLGAHSDDIEIGCGGTALALVRAYTSACVRWEVLSAGGLRDGEARSSAALFLDGAGDVEVDVQAFRDGHFPAQYDSLKAHFETNLKPFAPDIVFTHSREDRHQDHRVVSDLTWNSFRNHLILEYEVLKYDGDLGQPNVYIELEQKLVETKTKYIWQSFESQRDKHWFEQETLSSLARIRGVECRAAEGFAEAFYARKALLSFSRSD